MRPAQLFTLSLALAGTATIAGVAYLLRPAAAYEPNPALDEPRPLQPAHPLLPGPNTPAEALPVLPGRPCSACSGRGRLPHIVRLGNGHAAGDYYTDGTIPCPVCGGKGRVQ